MTDLPSSHGGGTLPGNQRGLSGSAATHTVVAARGDPATGTLLTLNLLPPRNEAFVAPTIDPFLLELHETNQQ